jgi:hypothetical protein
VPFILAPRVTRPVPTERVADVDRDGGFDATITVSKSVVLVIVLMQFVAAINGGAR